jgi:hypothetical protein
MKNGWICLHRRMLEWEWYSDTNVVRVFIHCLLKANWRDKRWRGMKIGRGSFFTSSSKIAEELHLTRMATRTALDKLKSTQEITTQSTNKGLLVTVLKYDSYNNMAPAQQPPEQPAGNHQATNEQPQLNKKNKGNQENMGRAPTPEESIEDEIEGIQPFQKDPNRVPIGATAHERWETIANHADTEYAELMATRREDVIRSLQKFALHFEEQDWPTKNWRLRLKAWIIKDSQYWRRPA